MSCSPASTPFALTLTLTLTLTALHILGCTRVQVLTFGNPVIPRLVPKFSWKYPPAYSCSIYCTPPPLRPGWGPQGPKGGATQGRAGQGRAAQGTRGRCGGTCQGGQRADLPPLHHQRQPEHNCACRLWAFRWSKQSISPGAVGIAGRGGGGGGGGMGAALK